MRKNNFIFMVIAEIVDNPIGCGLLTGASIFIVSVILSLVMMYLN